MTELNQEGRTFRHAIEQRLREFDEMPPDEAEAEYVESQIRLLKQLVATCLILYGEAELDVDEQIGGLQRVFEKANAIIQVFHKNAFGVCAAENEQRVAPDRFLRLVFAETIRYLYELAQHRDVSIGATGRQPVSSETESKTDDPQEQKKAAAAQKGDGSASTGLSSESKGADSARPARKKTRNRHAKHGKKPSTK